MPLPLLLEPLLAIGGKLIDRLIPDKEKAAEAQLKLAELAQSGELARMVNETELTKAVLADTQSARDREVQIATSATAPLINKLITPLLAIGVVTLTFVLFAAAIWLADGDLKQAQERVLFFVIGAAVPICSQVISYYFGSSRGDANKDQQLRDMLNRKD